MAKNTVKAWAVVNKKGAIVHLDPVLLVSKTRRGALTRSTFYETTRPCTITYDLPKKRAKK